MSDPTLRQRDDLLKIIREAANYYDTDTEPEFIADAILAAGWCKIDPKVRQSAVDAITHICLEKALMLTPQEAGMIADAVLALGRRDGMIEAAEIVKQAIAANGTTDHRAMFQILAAAETMGQRPADGIKP